MRLVKWLRREVREPWTNQSGAGSRGGVWGRGFRVDLHARDDVVREQRRRSIQWTADDDLDDRQERRGDGQRHDGPSDRLAGSWCAVGPVRDPVRARGGPVSHQRNGGRCWNRPRGLLYALNFLVIAPLVFPIFERPISPSSSRSTSFSVRCCPWRSSDRGCGRQSPSSPWGPRPRAAEITSLIGPH